MEQGLKNKVVIITGASSGFGEAMTRLFHAEGARLVLVARTKSKLEALQLQCPGVEIVAGDVCDISTYERALQVAVDQWGRLDVLINNAGGGVKIAHLEEQDDASITQAIELNLNSVMRGCKVVIPLFKAQKEGLIINVTSACAKFAWPGWSVYSAAKAGLSMFSRCLYTELQEHNVAVSVITPGGSNTGFQAGANIDSFEQDESNSLRPEHIAEAAKSIASMPKGGVVPEMVVYGMSQQIQPF